jgi:hypothetical protein
LVKMELQIEQPGPGSNTTVGTEPNIKKCIS